MIQKTNNIRSGCKDIWNAFMVRGAEFTIGSDMPICPCTTTVAPKRIISYVDAKHLHKTLYKDNPNYRIDAYVHFYIDDQKFDGPRDGIWANPYPVLEMLQHFSGAISPDFSTNADFPDPLKRYNTYRMRAYGRWLYSNNISVINNVRWGTSETWEYCFDGIPYNSMVAIGTVASGIRKVENRAYFEAGLYRAVELLNPHTIIIYGSSNYECFKTISSKGIKIVSFTSDTNLAFTLKKGGIVHE